MNSSTRLFRKLSGLAWLLVLAGSIGYITRYSLVREDMTHAGVQNVVPHSEYVLAEDQAAESIELVEQVAAQANAMAEVSTMKTRR